MLESNRQLKLDEVVEKLSTLPGVTNVHGDDWDSTGINVFWSLNVTSTFDDRPMSFEVSLQEHKRNLKRAMKMLNVSFRVMDYPVMKYEYTPAAFRFRGDPVKIKIGYDQSRFGIEIFV